MASVFTSRVTVEDGIILSHIDKNGAICIRQDFNNKNGKPFESEEEAQTWANAHIVEMQAMEAEAERLQERNRVLDNAGIVAAIAQAQQAKDALPQHAELLDAQVAAFVEELSK